MIKFSYIYIFGDSLSLCGHLKINQRWVQILKLKIKNQNKKTKVILRGINGITTTEALKKINFNIRSKSIVLIFFGTNDSVYYKSMKGRPRTNLELFKKNYISIIMKIRKNNKDCKIFLLNGHKFYRRRLEGNDQTHNLSYLKYKKKINYIARKTNSEIIDTYGQFLNYKPKMYCMKLPDGLHQNNFGSKKYSEIILKKISKLI